MKFFLALFSIVMLVQTSLATKDFNEADFAESVVKFFGEYAVAAAKATAYVAEKMPTTEAYEPYRAELKSFYETIDDIDSEKDLCFVKVYKFIEKFHYILNRLAKSDKPEAEHIKGLIYESIDKDFIGQFQNLMMSLLKYHFADHESDDHKVDYTKLKEYFTAEC